MRVIVGDVRRNLAGCLKKMFKTSDRFLKKKVPSNSVLFLKIQPACAAPGARRKRAVVCRVHLIKSHNLFQFYGLRSRVRSVQSSALKLQTLILVVLLVLHPMFFLKKMGL